MNLRNRFSYYPTAYPNTYSFNGMERDDEVKGLGNSYTTEFRQYDPRVGRWLSVDPLMGKYPNMSPYVALNNNPIFFADPLGLEGENPGEPEKGQKCWDENGNHLSYEGNGEWSDVVKNIDEVRVIGIKNKAENFNNLNLDNFTKEDYPYYMYVPSNTFTYNTINNWFGFNSRDMGYDPNRILSLSEEGKQNLMQVGPKSALLLLMGEFITGTGPETRRFGPSDPITKALMESYTVARGYAVIRDMLKNGTLADGQTVSIDIPYSPDNAGAMNSLGYHMQSVKNSNLIEFSRGSISMTVSRNGDNATIKVVDSYTITSANFMYRAQSMMGNSGDYIENISRREGEYLPMSTTTQEFIWNVNFGSIISDYKK
jgi:RHS repeat-associated protein